MSQYSRCGAMHTASRKSTRALRADVLDGHIPQPTRPSHRRRQRQRLDRGRAARSMRRRPRLRSVVAIATRTALSAQPVSMQEVTCHAGDAVIVCGQASDDDVPQCDASTLIPRLARRHSPPSDQAIDGGHEKVRAGGHGESPTAGREGSPVDGDRLSPVLPMRSAGRSSDPSKNRSVLVSSMEAVRR